MDSETRLLADLDRTQPGRDPVEITGSVVATGRERVRFTAGDPTSLLSAYLRLIRSVRQQRKLPQIALRRDDIDVLAGHLQLSSEETLDQLAALMGATMAQRSAIVSMFTRGALVVGIATATTVTFVGLPAAQGAAAAPPLPPDGETVEYVYDIGTPAGYPDAAELDSIGTNEDGSIYDIGTPAGYPDAAELDSIGTSEDGSIYDIGTPAGYPDAIDAIDAAATVQPAAAESAQPAVRVSTAPPAAQTAAEPDAAAVPAAAAPGSSTGTATAAPESAGHSDPRRDAAARDDETALRNADSATMLVRADPY